jgi:hypothetical protein
MGRPEKPKSADSQSSGEASRGNLGRQGVNLGQPATSGTGESPQDVRIITHLQTRLAALEEDRQQLLKTLDEAAEDEEWLSQLCERLDDVESRIARVARSVAKQEARRTAREAAEAGQAAEQAERAAPTAHAGELAQVAVRVTPADSQDPSGSPRTRPPPRLVAVESSSGSAVAPDGSPPASSEDDSSGGSSSGSGSGSSRRSSRYSSRRSSRRERRRPWPELETPSSEGQPSEEIPPAVAQAGSTRADGLLRLAAQPEHTAAADPVRASPGPPVARPAWADTWAGPVRFGMVGSAGLDDVAEGAAWSPDADPSERRPGLPFPAMGNIG